MTPPSPRQRWGTCCPSDPACEHSFLDVDDLRRWMDQPITDEAALMFEHGFEPHPAALADVAPRKDTQ